MKWLFLIGYFFSPMLFIAVFLLEPVDVVMSELASPSNVLAFLFAISAYVWLCWQCVLADVPRSWQKIVSLKLAFDLHSIMPLVILFCIFAHMALLNINGHGIMATMRNFFGSLTLLGFLVLVVADFLFSAPVFNKRLSFIVDFRAFVHNRLHIPKKLFVNLPYFTIVVISTLFVHMMLISGKQWFKLVTMLLYFIAVGFFVHKVSQLFKAKQRLSMIYTVANIKLEAPDVITVDFIPEYGEVFKFNPGQYLYVKVLREDFPKEAHPFSIISSPDDNTKLTITTRKSGDYTSYLVDNLKLGDKVQIEGPIGTFSPLFYNHHNDLFLVAGVFGITPYMSILRYYFHRNPEKNITLIWNVNSIDEMIFAEEIKNMQESMPNLIFIPILSKEPWSGVFGYVDKNKLLSLIPTQGGQKDKVDFFLCGPALMVTNVMSILKGVGYKEKNIHFEIFIS